MGFREDMPPEIRPFMGQVFRDFDEDGDDSIGVVEFLKRERQLADTDGRP